MNHIGFFTGAITIENVREASPERIYYGAQTCWWTHDPAHLCKEPSTGLPCDPRGGMLLQTDDVEGFLKAAESNPTNYGKHGIVAFMAAHHLNTTVGPSDVRSTCFTSWDDYNRILDDHVVDVSEALNQSPSLL
jgi:hypothetical protein